MPGPPHEWTPLHRPWSLRALVDELRAGASAAGAAARARARIAATDPTLRAWVELRPDDEPSTPAGPLAGAPLGVKDIVDLAGLPTRCGSPVRTDAGPAPTDAAVVTAWRAAGAVPIGKTVTTEFAFFSPGPTRNPAAPDHTPGGSSSGSAAAVAAGQVPLALGSQTAGSTVRPASFCGIAGLVVSGARIPFDGVAALSPTLDRHGVFAASVSDLALGFSALTGEPDAGRSSTRPLRLAVWDASRLGVVEPVMAAAFADAVRLLRDDGATLAPFPLAPLLDELVALHPGVLAHEAAREHRSRDGLSATLRSMLDEGDRIPEDEHARTLARIAAVRREVVAAMQDVDAVLAPAAPGPAPRGLGSTGDPALSRAWQALDLPALAVPGLRDPSTGLPLGVQLVGFPGAETALLGAGCRVETALARARR